MVYLGVKVIYREHWKKSPEILFSIFENEREYNYIEIFFFRQTISSPNVVGEKKKEKLMKLYSHFFKGFL